MTRIATALALGAAIALVAAPRGHAQSPQTPPVVFRTNADLVTIPVFVKGRGADTPLTSKDFVLTDNGVAQTVEMLESESLPVDVTVLMETGAAIEGYRKSLNEQVRRIAALMRPTDRIEVLGIDNYVHVLVPFGPPTRTLTVEAFTGGGMMAPNDAIVAALLRQADPDRRHLVIAMSDTIDSMSTLTMAQVRDVAKHSQATLVISWITLSADGAPSTDRPTPWATSGEREDRHVKAPVTLGALPLLGIPGLPQHTPTPPTGRTVPVRQHWMAHYDPPPGRALAAFDFLKEAAEFNGGALHPPGVFTDRNAAAIFERIYAEFRQNVILRYRPDGVARDGWHDVVVTVPSKPGAEVRARRGYFVDVDAPAPAATMAAPATVLSPLIAAAEQGDVAAMRTAIDPASVSALMAAFDAAGNIWPAAPEREFVAALVLADVAMRSAEPAARAAAEKLLQREVRLVRPPTGPTAFTRDWVAAANLLMASSASGTTPGLSGPEREQFDARLSALARTLTAR